MTDMTGYERVGHASGLAAGLAIALAGVDVAAEMPGQIAAVPAADIRDTDSVVAHRLAAMEGISFVRSSGRVASTGMSTGSHTGSDEQIGVRLAAVRLGLANQLLELAVRHLAERTNGDEPLLRKQLVIGSIADVTSAIEALRRYIAVVARKPSQEALADIHEQITEVDWQVTKFFGASGYITDHPVRSLYVSALVANTWVGKGAVR
jgi:hypothetical protein